ncbi:MAG TPA: hypothetical protein VJ111_13180 [Chitinophagaceae bacterium]|nr:hypothetical protein [Chitinophagaceae bacterium]
MKKILAICLLLITAFTSHAQQPIIDCNCPTPKEGIFYEFCYLVEDKDINYKQELMEMSCVDLKTDSKETINAKVNCMWEKYYHEFWCGDFGFPVPQGNILKYAVNQEFELFIDALVEEFGLDINIKDPADGKTLLDFVTDEIKRYKRYISTDNGANSKEIIEFWSAKVKELESIYDHLKNDFYALHANELASKPNYKRGTEISLSEEILVRYIGKYSLEIGNRAFILNLYIEKGKLMFSVDGKKAMALRPETPTIFFDNAQVIQRYYFSFDKVSQKYNLSYGDNKTKRIE